MMILLLCIGCCALCGCERSLQTDVVLFCQAFNAHSSTMVLREENTFRRSETEYLLYADDILLRLITDDTQAIHTVVLTAGAEQTDQLQSAALCAFAALAEPFSEDVPQTVLQNVRTGSVTVDQTETEHFIYLLYRSPESVTVQQINRHDRSLMPGVTLHPAADRS